MNEDFYRNIAALQEPQVAPKLAGVTDLTTWIVEQLEPRLGEAVLDIGCGNGKRTLPLAHKVGERGYVLAVDRSFDALSALSQQSRDARLETRIRFLQVGLDDFAGHLHRESFDRALGSRSLFQVRHPQSVFHAIHQALRPAGVLFLYGPTRLDHAELKRFDAELRSQTTSPYEQREPTFIESTGLQCARDLFAEVEIRRYEQPLRFDSPEALHACWSVSRLYDETLEHEFHHAAARYFASHALFETVQRVIGIRATR